MSIPTISSGLDGITASGNVPTWFVQEADMVDVLTESTESIPASVFTASGTVKADCYHNMGGVNFTRTDITRDRKRACEKVTVTRKTGETIEGTVEAIYDQQADADAQLNAVYAALPEGSTVYTLIAYGHDSMSTQLPKRVDIYRGQVRTRAKNQPVEGEDLMFTGSISADLYIPDVTVTPGS